MAGFLKTGWASGIAAGRYTDFGWTYFSEK